MRTDPYNYPCQPAKLINFVVKLRDDPELEAVAAELQKRCEIDSLGDIDLI